MSTFRALPPDVISRLEAEHRKERIVKRVLLACAAISILITVSIGVVLHYETYEFFRLPIDLTDSELVAKRSDLQRLKEARPDLVGKPWNLAVEFFTTTTWSPLFSTKRFGILPLVMGTLITSAVAMLVAVPVGLGAAIYLSEIASAKARARLKPMLEMLAGIPTIVYGYFALTFVTPFLQDYVFGSSLSSFNALSAGLVMGIMILPLVASLSEDAMRSVPRPLREGAYGLGATRFEVATRVVLPAALSGIAAACILALSRAVGETMIVALAAGQTPNFSFDPRQQMSTITAFIVQVSLGDTPYQSVEYRTLFVAGMLLALMTLAMNVASNLIVRRYRERYS